MQIFSVNTRHPVEASEGASLEEKINVFSEGDENLLLKIVTVSLWETRTFIGCCKNSPSASSA
jgi:hypothetical protein